MTINDAYQTLFNSYPDVLGVKEITEMLGIGKPLVYKMIHEGVLKTIPCGYRFRVAKMTVIEYLINNGLAA